MARTFVPKDVYAVMNALVYQATGQTDIAVVDTSSFIDAGTKILETGTENVFNAISVLVGKTVVASRAYEGKFKLVQALEDVYGIRFRKISFYAKKNQASGMYNTDLNTNLAAGLSDVDGVGSQWEQCPAIPVQLDFYSEAVYDKCMTVYPEQLKKAFKDETEFLAFMNGIVTEVWNDLESNKEAKARALVIDRIGALKKLTDDQVLDARCAVNMTAYYNEVCGTSYTTQEIQEEHLDDFLKVWTAKIAIDSDRLTDRTAHYHDPLKKTIDGEDYYVLRHTPKAKQRFVYYKPFFSMARTRVLPTIFNPEYLPENAGEGINFWQSFDSPMSVAVKPALPDGATSANVEVTGVLGLLYDEDAMMMQTHFDSAYTTPLNARHVYQNTWYHFNFGFIQDYTENSILYYMADED